VRVLDDGAGDGGGVDDGFYPSGSPYRVQRHAANIRERKRMLRCVNFGLFLDFFWDLSLYLGILVPDQKNNINKQLHNSSEKHCLCDVSIHRN